MYLIMYLFYHLTLLQKENIIIHSDFATIMPIVVNRFITIAIMATVVRIYTIMMLVSSS